MCQVYTTQSWARTLLQTHPLDLQAGLELCMVCEHWRVPRASLGLLLALVSMYMYGCGPLAKGHVSY